MFMHSKLPPQLPAIADEQPAPKAKGKAKAKAKPKGKAPEEEPKPMRRRRSRPPPQYPCVEIRQADGETKWMPLAQPESPLNP